MKKRFLLHTCCAPCSIAIIDELRGTHDLTAFFYNPNIYPEAEYLKRKAEVVRLCQEWGVGMVDEDYRPEEWESVCGEGGADKEGGPRCSRCIKLRLGQAADYAAAHGYDLWSSSLSSGRQKVTYVVTLIGEREAERVGVPYLGTDWKKGGRQEKARRMLDERGVYRQDYCGCRFSLAARDAKRKE
jgi:hypothetical protein